MKNPSRCPGDGAHAKPQATNGFPQPATSAERQASEDAQQNGTEVHALLCERFAELQEDRRGRIQKMVDFLAGK